jgi:hypothetical protein
MRRQQVRAQAAGRRTPAAAYDAATAHKAVEYLRVDNTDWT